jgi:hypothetical protein
MVHVTEDAKQALFDAMRAAGVDAPEVGLRLSLGPQGGLSLVPDRPKAGDDVVRHGEHTVLLVDPQTAALAVSGRSIDCRRDDEGEVRFFLRRTRPEERRSSVA